MQSCEFNFPLDSKCEQFHCTIFKWMRNKVPAYCFVYFHLANAMIVCQIFVLGFEYFDKSTC